MRLLHPRTLEIAASRSDIPKTVISHVWSECFKFKAGNRSHPKMWIKDDYVFGGYLSLVYVRGYWGKQCNLDINKIKNLSKRCQEGFSDYLQRPINIVQDMLIDWEREFDKSYLFSDAVSLYFKGINIFEDIFPGEAEKYIPVISHKEILRQVTKTLNKKYDIKKI